MNFVLTPYFTDFRRMCIKHGLSRNDTHWIRDYEQLHGLIIFPVDNIIYGEQYFSFATNVQERLAVEISIRKRYAQEK